MIVIPFSTATVLNHDLDIKSITIGLKGSSKPDTFREKLYSYLDAHYSLQGNVQDYFQIKTSSQMTEQFDNIINAISLVLVAVVSISLLVGGIGIMNVMLISVTERTKEIGICKAIGATDEQIFLQFLVEASLLSIFGALIGTVVGKLLSLFSLLIPGVESPITPVWAYALALLFSIVAGVIFGLYPAIKAAKLNPIDALSHE